MSRYAFGMKAVVRSAFLPCPTCKATVGDPCITWWNILTPLGFVVHIGRVSPPLQAIKKELERVSLECVETAGGAEAMWPSESKAGVKP